MTEWFWTYVCSLYEIGMCDIRKEKDVNGSGKSNRYQKMDPKECTLWNESKTRSSSCFLMSYCDVSGSCVSKQTSSPWGKRKSLCDTWTWFTIKSSNYSQRVVTFLSASHFHPCLGWYTCLRSLSLSLSSIHHPPLVSLLSHCLHDMKFSYLLPLTQERRKEGREEGKEIWL